MWLKALLYIQSRVHTHTHTQIAKCGTFFSSTFCLQSVTPHPPRSETSTRRYIHHPFCNNTLFQKDRGKPFPVLLWFLISSKKGKIPFSTRLDDACDIIILIRFVRLDWNAFYFCATTTNKEPNITPTKSGRNKIRTPPPFFHHHHPNTLSFQQPPSRCWGCWLVGLPVIPPVSILFILCISFCIGSFMEGSLESSLSSSSHRSRRWVCLMSRSYFVPRFIVFRIHIKLCCWVFSLS